MERTSVDASNQALRSDRRDEEGSGAHPDPLGLEWTKHAAPDLAESIIVERLGFDTSPHPNGGNMTDKQKYQPESETQNSEVAPSEVTQKKTKQTREHGSQVPDVNPPSVQPGHRDREQV